MAELDGVKVGHERDHRDELLKMDGERITLLEEKLEEAETILRDISEYRDHLSIMSSHLEDVNGGMSVGEGISRLGQTAGAERLHARVLRSVVGQLHLASRYKPEMLTDDED